MKENLAISVENITKVYRLYDKPIDRLKEALSIRHKEYHKKFFALDEISFEVEKGSTVGIIGTNGSGKSTLLSMIPAYTFATKGEVSVFDKKFGTCVWAEIKEKVGFVSSTLNNFSDK